MEPNEMVLQRYHCHDSAEYWLTENDYGNWVRYSDAMQIITALQSQIDGMIKRPTVEVVADEEDCWVGTETQWHLMRGNDAREFWDGYIQWLPYSALPKGDV